MIRLAFSCLLAAICVFVLGERVHRSFNRVRVRVVTQPQHASGASMVIPLPAQVSRLPGPPVAVIVHVWGASEPADFTLSLNSRQLAAFSVAGEREVRIDTSTDFLPAQGQELSLQATRAGWTLMYVELATVHGYSGGPLSLVVVPHGAVRDRILPTWMSILLFLLLAASRPRLDWPPGRKRLLHRAAAGLILLIFILALVASMFTQYLILLSFRTWLLGVLVLYAEPMVRAWRHPLRRLPVFHGEMPMPWWTTLLDAACLLLVSLILRAWLGDGYRISLPGGVRLSLSSGPRLAMWLTMLLVLRHYFWREPSWPVRVTAWIRAAWGWEPFQAARAPFLTSRLAVMVAAYVAVFTIGFEGEAPWRALNNDVLDLYYRWDSGWYVTIATQGYPREFHPELMSAVAFFPALPLLMLGMAALLDVHLLVGGILLVTGAFLWGLTYLYRLALQDLPSDQARASLMFLAFYPFAFCYSVVLTESLFLLAAVAAFYHFRRTELGRAAAFGLLGGALRPNGCLLSIPLALLTLLPFARSRGWLPGPATGGSGWRPLIVRLAAATAPVIGMAAYAVYINSVTGNPFAWIEAQRAWGRAAAEGLNIWGARSALIETQGIFAYTRSYPIEIIEAAAAFFALGAIGPIVRRFGLAYGVFVAISVLPPLISMGSISLGRYTAPLFPIFLWLGAAVPPARRPYWIAVFAAGQALLATLFFTWRPPY